MAETQAQRDKRLCEEQWVSPGVGNTMHYSGWRMRGASVLEGTREGTSPLAPLKGRIASIKAARPTSKRKTK